MNASFRKRSISEMSESGDVKGQSHGEAVLPHDTKTYRPYVKAPLPRYPTGSMVLKKNKEGRYVKTRAFGNYPHTVLEPSLKTSWEAHVSKRIKRPVTSSLCSGRERLRQEMIAEDDLALSQGDVSKKGSAVPFNLSLLEAT